MLSIVIPVHNAEYHLRETVEGIFRNISYEKEVILVDDASIDATRSVMADLSKQFKGIRCFFHSENKGAGAARNTGLCEVRGEFVLFFDSDDLIIEGAVDRTLDILETSDADFAFTPYRYSKGRSGVAGGMHTRDGQLWASVMQGQSKKEIDLDTGACLLTFTNYPWNKILRTNYAREIGLYFSETPVNNDIHAHWQCLLGAKNILMVDEAFCLHIVPEDGNNITNMHDRRRLAVFQALDDTETLFNKNPELRRKYYYHFAEFKVMLMKWARDRIEARHKAQFNESVYASFGATSFADYLNIKSQKPKIASEVSKLILRQHPSFSA
ncbi:hypothetical protein GCM10007094_33720 [Pseudovibrio japonicus]|uniref:Glycosyltransferase 2-like domain-containing protein n=1 Tax=Pseudovibrio japonicus TaxID=366534 RepID=A0ABQ3EMS2_9HYPH|nr:glycosyltransferase family 2 protein [Pseudovibrio japonicus]GHB41527.1 hypothetical protein GCM10007094_33720 [Pseudovibrio japonicus]